MALTLGGGGARGLAHIGVLEVLEEAGIPVSLIVSTSMGSIVGGLYAMDPDASRLREAALEYLGTESFHKLGLHKIRHSDPYDQNFFESLYHSLKRGLAFTYLLRRASLFETKVLERILADAVPNRHFEDLKIPLAITALNLLDGKEVVLVDGSVRQAMLASIALPGFFPPVRMAGGLLADIGFLGAIPADTTATLSDDPVVAVDVSQDFQEFAEEERFATGLQVLFRLESISARELKGHRLASANVRIRPDVGGTYWADFSDPVGLMEKGRVAARAALGAIEKAVGSPGAAVPTVDLVPGVIPVIGQLLFSYNEKRNEVVFVKYLDEDGRQT